MTEPTVTYDGVQAFREIDGRPCGPIRLDTRRAGAAAQWDKMLGALHEISDLCNTEPATWRAEDATVQGYERLLRKIEEVATNAYAPGTGGP